MSLFQNNLDALRTVLPAVAARIAEAAIPSGYESVTGTDGTPTFRRTVNVHGQSRWEWLGGTSMPRAAAGPITRALDAVSNGQNGLGLSIGTGCEWAALVGRLPRAQMVFVYEPDAGLVRMALTVCDLAAQLATCRIVLLTGSADEAGEELSRLLATREGLEVPGVLHPLPTLTGERRNALLAAGEAIVRRVVTQRQTLMGTLWQHLERAATSDKQATVAFLLTPRYSQERPLHAHVAAQGIRAATIDHHDTASAALRLRILADAVHQGATPVVISDLFRRQLGALPAGGVVETWVPPLPGAAYWQRLPAPASLALADRIVVHSGYHAQRLQEHGIPRTHIEVRPLRPMSLRHAAMSGEELQLRHRVAMIADLSATDAASLGIDLPTHQEVFAAATDVVKTDYLTIHPGMAADVLRRALTRAGIDPKVDDPALKEPMLRIIRDVLIPSLPPLVLAGELARQGVALTLLGDWTGANAHVPANAATIIPFETYTPAAWQDAALLVHHSPEGAFTPLMWEAVAAGVALVATAHASDAFEGSVPTLLQPDQQFAQASAANFISTIKSLLRDATRRTRLAEAARQIIS